MRYAIRALCLSGFCLYPIHLFSNVTDAPAVIPGSDTDTSVFKDFTPAEQSEYALVLLSILLLLCAVFYMKNNKLNKKLADGQTLQKKADREIEQLKSTLQFKNKLISIIAHDVRGPVSSILFYLDIQDDEYFDREVYVSLKHTMLQQLTAVGQLLGNLLQWTLSENQTSSKKLAVFNLYELAEQNMSMLQGYYSLKKLTVVNLIPRQMKMHGVKNEIDVVIRNLIFNAVKFTREGGEIKIFTSERPSGLAIVVQDNGIGMDAGRVSHLFELEDVYSSSGTNGERGSGLGLVLCKELVQKNGGKIYAESEIDKGSSFKMEFPSMMFV